MKQTYNQDSIVSKGLLQVTTLGSPDIPGRQRKTWPLVIFHMHCKRLHTSLNAFRLPENRFPNQICKELSI